MHNISLFCALIWMGSHFACIYFIQQISWWFYDISVKYNLIFTLLLFSHPVVSKSLWPHGLQHTRPLCPSPSPKVCPSSCPLVMPSSHLILWCPLLLLPSTFPSIRHFSSESAVLVRLPKYWSFSFSISPSKKYSGLISLNIDWFDLLAVQESLRSLQHHSSKASILCCSVFTVQLSQPYVTTGKTIAFP